MNKLIALLCFIGLFSTADAQTSSDKNNFSVGFGTQEYKGNLGNTLFDFEYEWYGVFKASYSRYLTPSFDASVFLTTGDYGHCHNDDDDNVASNGESILEFRARLTTVAGTLKYKFANNYLLKENAKFAPFVYAGAALNSLRNIWQASPRGNMGNYMTYNMGWGVAYNINPRLQLIYNMGFGFFTSNNITFDSNTNPRDIYMQNTFSIGFNL